MIFQFDSDMQLLPHIMHSFEISSDLETAASQALVHSESCSLIFSYCYES